MVEINISEEAQVTFDPPLHVVTDHVTFWASENLDAGEVSCDLAWTTKSPGGSGV